MFGRKKGNYLIVCHCYWMGHISWHEKLFLDATEKEAAAESALLEKEFRRDFNHAEAKAFLLPDTVQVITDARVKL